MCDKKVNLLAHKGNARNDLKEFTIQLADKEKA
jgi:hypothetical protein